MTTKDEAISELMKIAAKLLTRGPSDFREDYPRAVPNYVVREMQKHRESQRLMAIKIKEAIDTLRK